MPIWFFGDNYAILKEPLAKLLCVILETLNKQFFVACRVEWHYDWDQLHFACLSSPPTGRQWWKGACMAKRSMHWLSRRPFDLGVLEFSCPISSPCKRGLKVSRPLVANYMILFDNLCSFFKWQNMYIMAFSISTLGHSRWKKLLSVSKGKLLLSILMASGICLHFSMQEEDTLQYTNIMCYLCTL